MPPPAPTNKRWERRRRTLLRNFLEKPGLDLDAISEGDEPSSTESDGSSLPDLIIEPEPNRHDDPPEFYEALEQRMLLLHRKLFKGASENAESVESDETPTNLSRIVHPGTDDQIVIILDSSDDENVNRPPTNQLHTSEDKEDAVIEPEKAEQRLLADSEITTISIDNTNTKELGNIVATEEDPENVNEGDIIQVSDKENHSNVEDQTNKTTEITGVQTTSTDWNTVTDDDENWFENALRKGEFARKVRKRILQSSDEESFYENLGSVAHSSISEDVERVEVMREGRESEANVSWHAEMEEASPVLAFEPRTSADVPEDVPTDHSVINASLENEMSPEHSATIPRDNTYTIAHSSISEDVERVELTREGRESEANVSWHGEMEEASPVLAFEPRTSAGEPEDAPTDHSVINASLENEMSAEHSATIPRDNTIAHSSTSEDVERVEVMREGRESEANVSWHGEMEEANPVLAFEPRTSADVPEDAPADHSVINASLENEMSAGHSATSPRDTRRIIDDFWSVSSIEVDFDNLPDKRRSESSEDGPARKKRKEMGAQTSSEGTANWEDICKNFFVGTPLVYRLCQCKDHDCSHARPS